MNILLTNDDGAQAEGIKQLAHALSQKHNVYVSAPNGECSGAGHSITFFNALTYRKVDYPDGIEAYEVTGTPVDCVKFGLDILFAKINIDLVVSGINNVLNIGTDVFYSGTANAAIEATIVGKKAVAISTNCSDGDYAFPCDFTAKNIEKLAKYAGASTTLNVNIPSNKKSGNKGVVVAELGLRRFNDSYVLVSAPNEQPRFILTGTPVSEVDSAIDHDVALSDRGYITVTPLTLYTTDFEVLERMDCKEFEF